MDREIGHALHGHRIERERLSGRPRFAAVRRTRSGMGNGQTETKARSNLKQWAKDNLHPNESRLMPHTLWPASSVRDGVGWVCPKRKGIDAVVLPKASRQAVLSELG